MIFSFSRIQIESWNKMSAQSVAVIVAHPDDEILGFGGAMARHVDRGDDVSVLILATGLASRDSEGSVNQNSLEELRDNAQSAGKIIGTWNIEFGDFPDNQMDSVSLLEVVKRVEEFIADFSPAVVYTHHAGDLNIDHRIVAQATMTACRPLPGAGVLALLAGEVNSSTEWASPGAEFRPNEFVEIDGVLDRKLRALACYSGELRDWPHPRSIKAVEALARWRGSQVGLNAAEAFSIVRRVCR
jgi:N-acetylglucosamine malate deacetylase 1